MRCVTGKEEKENPAAGAVGGVESASVRPAKWPAPPGSAFHSTGRDGTVHRARTHVARPAQASGAVHDVADRATRPQRETLELLGERADFGEVKTCHDGVPEGREYLGSAPRADVAGSLAEDDVANPVKPVLDAPVRPNDLERRSCVEGAPLPARYREGNFGRGLAPARGLARDPHDRAHSGPVEIVVQPICDLETSPLEPAVPFLDRRRHVVRELSKSMLSRGGRGEEGGSKAATQSLRSVG